MQRSGTSQSVLSWSIPLNDICTSDISASHFQEQATCLTCDMCGHSGLITAQNIFSISGQFVATQTHGFSPNRYYAHLRSDTKKPENDL